MLGLFELAIRIKETVRATLLQRYLPLCRCTNSINKCRARSNFELERLECADKTPMTTHPQTCSRGSHWTQNLAESRRQRRHLRSANTHQRQRHFPGTHSKRQTPNLDNSQNGPSSVLPNRHSLHRLRVDHVRLHVLHKQVWLLFRILRVGNVNQVAWIARNCRHVGISNRLQTSAAGRCR